jgi:hypothetical protein
MNINNAARNGINGILGDNFTKGGKYAEIWRHEWEGLVNRYYAENGLEERVDLRSYERQGIDTVPTVHMGPAVTQMEKRGMVTIVGTLNRDIK